MPELGQIIILKNKLYGKKCLILQSPEFVFKKSPKT